jgi:hypothetical protein
MKRVTRCLKTSYYLGLMYISGSKIATKKEDTFYLVGQKLIRWIDPNGKIVNENEYSVKQKEILDDLTNYVFKK